MKKIFKNYLFNASFQLLLILVPFITTPYIARVLGPENLGIQAYTFSIIQVLIIIGMIGIPLYGNRQIATASVKGKDEISREFWSIYLLQLTMLFASIIFYFIYSLSLPDYMQKISLLQGIHLLASMLDISWFLLGLQQIKQVAVRNLLIKVISIMLIFTFVNDVNDLDIYILIISCSTFGGQIFLWSYSRKYINFRLKLRWHDSSKHIKPILVLFLPQILGQLYLSFDKIVLNYYSTAAQVGYYDQAMKIVRLATTLVTSLGAVVLPSIATEFALGNKEKIYYYVKMILKYILFITIPMALGLVSISDNFVQWFLGSNFLEVAKILQIVSPIIIFVGLGSLFGIQILAATHQSGKLTFSIFCGAIVSVLISLIFVPKYGVYATAYATLLTEVAVASIQLYFVKEFLKIKDIKKSLIFYLVSGIFMFGIIHVINLVNMPVISKTFLQIGVGIITYISMLLLFKEEFTNQLKEQLILIIKLKLKIKK